MTESCTLAGYVLKERIAVGGMAEIYRAVRTGPFEFAKSVAIKIVLPDLGRDPQFVDMFLQEARLAAQLSSPHLVQVFDFGQDSQRYFLVMEYVDGVDLAALLAAAGPLPWAIGLHLGRQLCAALADLHSAVDADGNPLGIVHRDVNPGNVLLSTAGDIKLGDFGIAKARARSVRTERGAIKGKLAYLSPEQVRGDELDGRTDLYGVGLLLFEALTGQRYLLGDSEADLLRAAARPAFRSPQCVRAELPTQVDDVLARALAVDPVSRYAEASQLDEALRSAMKRLGDAGDLRRKLGEMVRLAKTAMRPDEAYPEDAPSPAAGPLVSRARRAPGPARPRTQLLDSATEKTRGRWKRLGGMGIALAAGVLTVAIAARWLTIRHSANSTETAASNATLPAPTARHAGDATAELAVDSSTAGPDVGARGAESRRTRGTRARQANGGHLKPEAGQPDQGPGEQGREPVSEARADLEAVDRILAQKGVLPADAPELFARRRALARSGASVAGARDLLGRTRAIVVDRAFVHAKLKRLNRKMVAATVDPRLQQRLQQRAQQALAHAVTGRYAEANRELNVIAAVIER